MKKGLCVLCLILLGCWGIYFYKNTPIPLFKETIYIHAANQEDKNILSPLYSALKKEGYKTRLLTGNEKGGLFNLYYAANINSLPHVQDKKAINFLWTPVVSDKEDPENLRDFDVIIVKSMGSFEYLKAINVRTAYIPDAVNMKRHFSFGKKKELMFYGDNQGFNLALWLAKNNTLSVDVYGKNFENTPNKDDVKNGKPNFSKYELVLVDQTEEEIKNEIVNSKIIKVIEEGGLPYIRFNNGVKTMFDDAVPMYYNPDHFGFALRQILHNQDVIQEKKNLIKMIATHWDAKSQALKFAELFDLMKKKLK
jgi:hypothetical protein